MHPYHEGELAAFGEVLLAAQEGDELAQKVAEYLPEEIFELGAEDFEKAAGAKDWVAEKVWGPVKGYHQRGYGHAKDVFKGRGKGYQTAKETAKKRRESGTITKDQYKQKIKDLKDLHKGPSVGERAKSLGKATAYSSPYLAAGAAGGGYAYSKRKKKK